MTKPAKKKQAGKKPVGRPLEYTEEMGDLICELTASTGYGLLKLTQLYPELPAKETINRWRYRVPKFQDQYALAKLKQADLLAEECLEIADDASLDITYDKDGNEICNTEFIARSRLRIDTRKWLASKLLPKQYGSHVVKDENNDQSKSILEKIITGEIKVNND